MKLVSTFPATRHSQLFFGAQARAARFAKINRLAPPARVHTPRRGGGEAG